MRIEVETLRALEGSIGASFVASVRAIFNCGGRLVVTGVGKTAIVAKKIVATMNSTGTPSLFLHAADAIHGDIGMVQEQDVVLCLSKSGETAEIKVLAMLVRQLGNPLIAMVSKADCTLGRLADHVLLTPIIREADPNDLAPTASTTAQMALGDAMASALLTLKGFTHRDFAKYHPGGSLGKQLYLRVRDLATHNAAPAVGPAAPLRDVLLEMSSKRLGATAVLDPRNKELLGIVTDGDLRRMLSKSRNLEEITATDIMTVGPKTIREDALAVKALDVLRTHNISQLIVMDEADQYVGFLHLHDLIREGIV
nr:KpsF/GutQ family sugar-phosphate isomerase [Lewinella sp. W8]